VRKQSRQGGATRTWRRRSQHCMRAVVARHLRGAASRRHRKGDDRCAAVIAHFVSFRNGVRMQNACRAVLSRGRPDKIPIGGQVRWHLVHCHRPIRKPPLRIPNGRSRGCAGFPQKRAPGASLGASWVGYDAVLHAELLIGAGTRCGESLSSEISDAISNKAALPASNGVGTAALMA
jgi:hypothetical protein